MKANGSVRPEEAALDERRDAVVALRLPHAVDLLLMGEGHAAPVQMLDEDVAHHRAQRGPVLHAATSVFFAGSDANISAMSTSFRLLRLCAIAT